jgi:hypothetical protein
MANSPTDAVPSMMKEDFGTCYLITDPRADKLLERSEKLGSERYKRWCGGRNGFDDYSERLH